MNAKYEKLKGLLKELFQLDQPDLDFGIYRIMHARGAEVTKFLDEDLLPQVKEAFSAYRSADKGELEKELTKVIAGIEAAGMKPEDSPKVKQLRDRIANEAVDIAALENEVYDHLFGFFRRYYSEGDFLSKRVYKEGVYAIPYEGEEVKLHWANHDQFYIKTSEYLRDYAFRLKPNDAQNPKRVHFRLVDADEGEHGNVKAAEGKDRVFILTAEDFVCEENGELSIRFEYRPATIEDWPKKERSGKAKPPAQKELLRIAAERMHAVADAKLAEWIRELSLRHMTAGGEAAEYSRLEAHLRRYTARNTFDYFIHKNLNGFLRRELDFYLKNEVMHLDDIENESSPRVEQYLSKLKVIRRIAGKIIKFLAQLEEFQKKLWLKKKFVVETRYCVALGSVPEEFYPEIVKCKAQWEEWEALHGISKLPETDGPLFTEKRKLKSENWLKANPTLMIDTGHFPEEFTARLLAAIGDLDAITDGVLFHSENFQALSVMQSRYRERVKCIYIDPPYNTDAGPISYKNGYRSSSWASLMADRLRVSHAILKSDDGIMCATIDDYQQRELHYLMESEFGIGSFAGTVAIRINPSGRPVPSGFAQSHEYAIFARSGPQAEIGLLPRTDAQMSRYGESDSRGPYMWELFRKRGSNSERKDRPSLYYPIFYDGHRMRIPKMEWESDQRQWRVDETPRTSEQVLYPIDENGIERTWRWKPESISSDPSDFSVKDRSGAPVVYYKFRPNMDGVLPLTLWSDAKYSATEHGTGTLKSLFVDYNVFSYPKSIFAVMDCISISGLRSPGQCVLDFFAGSGTTGHAAINLNREDGGQRKFVLVEMGAYFETVLLPRLKKVTFSPEWKDGKPKRLTTIEEAARSPRVMKVVRLESYEDTLNNLDVRRTDSQQNLLNLAKDRRDSALREEYMLRYMLDVETRGSQSLLNIEAFSDPTSYRLKVKLPGSDESREVNVDLLETFNWLIGLTVRHITAPQTIAAEFKRDEEKRLILKNRLKEDAAEAWWFRSVAGETPDGRKTLVIWRKLTGDPEKDNLVLDAWFQKQGYSAKDSEFDTIYVNGGNNLENLKTPEDTWKVRLLEEDFHRLMFDGSAN